MTPTELDRWHVELMAEFQKLEETHRQFERGRPTPADCMAHL